MDGVARSTRFQVKVPAPKPKAAEVPVRVAEELAAVSGDDGGDYIDKVWRDRTQGKTGTSGSGVADTSKRHFTVPRPRLGGRFPRSVAVTLFAVAVLVLGGVVY